MRNVLAIGAHPDDIELGCGGTLIKHATSGDTVTLLVVTKGEVGPGMTTARIAEQERAVAIMGAHELVWGELPDCEVGLHELSLVHIIESLIKRTRPDVIYTHSSDDSHQDHRAVALGTFGAARQCSNILTYDSPSSMHFTPNVFVDITGTLDKKIEALQCHASQVAACEMVNAERVRNGAGYRGHEARCGAAEAFSALRFVFDV